MKKACILGSILGAVLSLATGCNLGPFPVFLEPLDPLDPVEGLAKGWLLSRENETEILVLSESGQFLRSRVGRDTSVILESGSFEIEGSSMSFHSEYRYEFPIESGPVKSREGAQSEEVAITVSSRAEIVDGKLILDGIESYSATSDFVASLDLSRERDRGCLLRFVEMSNRTIQSRIRNFGGAGTVIYHHNKSSFAGFLEGELTIDLEGDVLSPETVMTYESFRDFPEIRLSGTFLTHIHNPSGDGTMGEAVDVEVITPSFNLDVENEGYGGLGGRAGGGKDEVLLALGSLEYGGDEPIEIEGGDVVDGSYTFRISKPFVTTDERPWTFLNDLDFRGCTELSNE